MTEATACAWLETSEYNHHATWISYTTSNRDNEFFIAFINPTTVRLAIAGKGYDFTVPQLTSETKVKVNFPVGCIISVIFNFEAEKMWTFS